MEFVDHTGHVFSLPSYKTQPIGYEYNVNPYIFWVDDEYTFKLSINTYYIKPIRFLIDKDDFDFVKSTPKELEELGDDAPETNIVVTVDSNVYKLLGSKQIQDMLANNGNINNYLEFSEDDLKDTLFYTTSMDNDLLKLNGTDNDLTVIEGIQEIAYYKIIKKYKLKQSKVKSKKYTYKDIDNNVIEIQDEEEINEIINNGKQYIYTKKTNITEENFICIKLKVTDEELLDTNLYKIKENYEYYKLTYIDNFVHNDITIEQSTNIFYGYYIVDTNYDEIYQVSDESYIDYKYTYIDYYSNKTITLTDEQEEEIDKTNNTIYINYNRVYKGTIYNDDNNVQFGLETIDDNTTTEIKDIYKLNDSNIIYLNPVYHNYILCTFYVVANSSVQGTWNTNILISIYNNLSDALYCPITVGGVFDNVSEELIINGYNMGINLPKDIVRALYNTSFYDYYPNNTLYNEKIKELLLNYMTIRGECGNFRSAIHSLNWFGWHDKITISKLLQTDNQFMDQYIRDAFDIKDDVISVYKHFKNSALISLKVLENTETSETYPIDFNSENGIFGEGKPIMENLFDKIETVTYDEEDITFYRKYYDFIFQELGLKLACLCYYYSHYFLPIHLQIHSASISHKVYMNDIKMLNKAKVTITEQTELLEDTSVQVEFPVYNVLYFENSEHYMDRNYNEFYNSKQLGEDNLDDIFYVNEVCLPIPISFTCSDDTYPESFYDCVFVLTKNDKEIYENHFSFVQDSNDLTTFYKNLILVPRIINKDFDINYWINSQFVLYIGVNGKWFTFDFTCNIPEMKVSLGKLVYKYYPNDDTLYEGFSQLTENYKFKAFMYQPDLVKINDIKFPNKILNNKITINSLLTEYKESINVVNNEKYLNRIHVCDIYDEKMQKLVYSKDDDLNRLYSIFFYTEEDVKEEKEKINSTDLSLEEKATLIHKVGDAKINLSEKFEYDFYLMHDLNNWFCIFISKAPISELIFYKEELNFNYEKILVPFEENGIDKTYTIKYVKSDNRFLINRMDIELTNGHNHFDDNDIIVAAVTNPDRIAFNYDIGSKWTITPKSLGMVEESKVNSNTNIAMFSIGKSNIKYSKGYYSISVNYCVDNYIQHIQTKTCIFRVD